MSYASILEARSSAKLTIPISASLDTTLTIEQAQSLPGRGGSFLFGPGR